MRSAASVPGPQATLPSSCDCHIGEPLSGPPGTKAVPHQTAPAPRIPYGSGSCSRPGPRWATAEADLEDQSTQQTPATHVSGQFSIPNTPRPRAKAKEGVEDPQPLCSHVHQHPKKTQLKDILGQQESWMFFRA